MSSGNMIRGGLRPGAMVVENVGRMGQMVSSRLSYVRYGSVSVLERV